MRAYVVILLGFMASISMGASLTQEKALERTVSWMAGNPVMSKASSTVSSIETYPESGDYSVYVVQLDPVGYLILNSDDRLPLLVSFSPTSTVDLTDESGNALRSMLTSYCERMVETLAQPATASSALATTSTVEDELYGPFVETSWDQAAPYNNACPSGDLTGCVPTTFAQLMNYHRWPYVGHGSRTYTDSTGYSTGTYSADFSNSYNWDEMKAAHSTSDSQASQDAVAELMYELGVAAEVDYESAGTSANSTELASRLGEYLYYDTIQTQNTQDSLITPLEADLRDGFPCCVSYPGHAFIADGLMVSGGETTYHFNMGWGGYNNGWYTKDLVPAGSSGSTALDGGITSFRPQLIAFPESSTPSVEVGETASLRWILPKRLEDEVSALTIKQLVPQAGTWSSDASVIKGQSSGWEVVSSGHSGDCWYAGDYGSYSMVLKETLVPDASTDLVFWMKTQLSDDVFSISVSTDDGAAYTDVYSVSSGYSGWSKKTVSLSDYAGQAVRIKFLLDIKGSYYTDGGVWLDDLSVTSGSWSDWELFALDDTLASERFSAVATELDDCDDFSVFEETLWSAGADWDVADTDAGGSCFYKAEPTAWNNGCHLTMRSTITPTAVTRLLLRAKYMLYSGSETLQVQVCQDGQTFSQIWSASGSADWTDLDIDLSAYAGVPITVRLAYTFDGNFWSGGGIWIDSISTQEITNPELEGQPIHYTTLSDLPVGTHTLAAVLTNTNSVEHAVGPSFTLTVTAPENDSDADGLPNDWEILYFGDSTTADSSAMASNSVNTVLEAYVLGIDPTDATALFESELANGSVVQWSATSGRVYSIWSTTNLVDGFHTHEANVAWPQASWTNDVEGDQRYYRVDVDLAE